MTLMVFLIDYYLFITSIYLKQHTEDVPLLELNTSFLCSCDNEAHVSLRRVSGMVGNEVWVKIVSQIRLDWRGKLDLRFCTVSPPRISAIRLLDCRIPD